MTAKPIIFSGPMVQALLDGRKTQTRRLLKRRPHDGWFIYDDTGKCVGWSNGGGGMKPDLSQTSYRIGDRLYVREAIDKVSEPGSVFYRADYDAENPGGSSGLGWCPSSRMPRWASRLTLTVTDVRAQRLQEISEDDAIAEGAPIAAHQWSGDGSGTFCLTEKSWRRVSPTLWFHELWNSLYGPDAWDANPWVPAASFTVRKGNIDAVA